MPNPYKVKVQAGDAEGPTTTVGELTFTDPGNQPVGATPTLADVLAAGNDADAGAIANVANPTNPQDAATKDYVDGIVSSPTIADVLAAGNDANTNQIANVGGITGTTLVQVILQGGDGRGAGVVGSQGAAGQPGSEGFLQGGAGDAGAQTGALVSAQGGTALAPGAMVVRTKGVAGAGGQALVSDDAFGVKWAGVQVAAAPPVGTPTGLPFAYDTTAVTGGFYVWNGAAWVKVATIL